MRTNPHQLSLFAGAVLFSLNVAAQSKISPSASPHPRHVEGELLVKFQGGPRGAAAERARLTMQHEVKRHFELIGWQQLRLPKGMTFEEGLARYRKLPGVEAVEPNGILERITTPVARAPRQAIAASAAAASPNDPLFVQQYALEKIHAAEAWAVTTGSSNVVVAIIDTGINYLHVDLQPNLWRNRGEIPGNGLDDDGNGYRDDIYGIDTADDNFGNDSDPFNHSDPSDIFGFHGTACAGVVGAAGNNGLGITGVNWAVQIMAVRVFQTNGTTTFADLIEGLSYVASMKRRGENIRVLSLSLAGTGNNQAWKDAHDAVAREGVLQVAASANSGQNVDITPYYPACWDIPGLISVAASDENDNLGDDAYWAGSDYGPTNVDLAAPGVAIISTYGPGTNDYTPIFDLTSAATPLTAGSAALLFAANPSLTMQEVKDILLETVDVLPAFTNKMVSNGRLNVGRAMQHPSVRTNSPPLVAAQPQDFVATPGGTVALTARVIGTKPIFYQWRHDSSNLANATNVSLTLGSATAGEAGTYTLVASNAFGVVTTDVAQVSVTTVPIITTQPTSRTVIGGSTATLSVVAAGQSPLVFRWARDTTPVSGSSSNLVLNNVQASQAGGYSVIVSNAAGVITSAVAILNVILHPVITNQPVGASVSVGANLALQVGATGLPNLGYQWRRNTTELPGSTNASLTLTNVSLNQSGDYTVVVSNGGGAITSEVARVVIDGTFTKITSGPIIAETGTNLAGAWGDYDGDGYPDLFIAKSAGQNNALFHNNRDGTFSKMAVSPFTMDRADSRSAAWGDFDGDGTLDLVVANGSAQSEWLYRNSGVGTFTRLTSNEVGTVVGSAGDSFHGSWTDYDRDGQLDLFISNGSHISAQDNVLFHNSGDSTLARVTSSVVGTDGGRSYSSAWGDFDNDGWPDLFVSNGWGHQGFLYRNTGDGSFVRILTNAVATALTAHQHGAAWGDYDNDGDLDLFVAAYPWNQLFRNDGGGVFTEVAAASGISERGDHDGVAWGDFDNDGWLDVFVSNESERPADLYRNNGDGTFSRVTTGSPATDVTVGVSAAWADYDNNGFLDLSVTGELGTTNALYRNNGNGNHWLALKLLGTRSNRHAVGAKIRVGAVLGGATRWQLRQVGGDASPGQSDLRATFGLGDATKADIVRIEWPSGALQELTNVALNQFVTVTEPGLGIGLHPRDLAVRAGRDVTNTVVAFSDQPGLRYQWQFQGNNIPGQTNTALILTNAQWSMDGEYSVAVSDGLRAATSRVARLTVLIIPSIVQSPLSQEVVVGGDVTFSVTVSGNPSPFGYVWRRSSTTLAFVVRTETNCFFTLTNVQASQGGPNITYRVIITNAAQPTLSVNATWTLTVLSDADGDGLPDAWEALHPSAIDPSVDTDLDGLTNLEEYRAGTAPDDDRDLLQFENLALLNGRAAALRFGAKANKTYTIQHWNGVDGVAWTRLADFSASPTNGTLEFLDPSAALGPGRFYRLVTPRVP